MEKKNQKLSWTFLLEKKLTWPWIFICKKLVPNFSKKKKKERMQQVFEVSATHLPLLRKSKDQSE